MNNKKNLQKIAGVFVSGALFLGLAVTAFAEAKATAPATGAANVKATILTNEINRAGSAIDKRVSDLSALKQRISGMNHLDSATKASLSNSLESEISILGSLKTKISGDTDSATVKTDVKEITAGNRVYALVEPQTKILAATDKVNSVAAMITALVPKLQTRITTAQTAGKDVTAMNTALTDLQAKVADAIAKGTAATTGVTGLVPDKGDKTILASNNAALKAARANLQIANKDLNDANKDVKIITKGVKGTDQKGIEQKGTEQKGGTTGAGTTNKTQ